MLVIDTDMLVLESLIKRLQQQQHLCSHRKCPQEKDVGAQVLSAHPHQPQHQNQKLLNYQRALSKDDLVVIMGLLASQARQPLARLVKSVPLPLVATMAT